MWSLDPEPAVESVIAISGPAEYRAPSWSWASINGAIRIEPPYAYKMVVQERAKVIAVKAELVAFRDRFGQVKAGYLILRGNLYRVDNSLENASEGQSASLPAAHKVLQASILFAPGMMHEYRQQHKPCRGQHFALMQLIKYANVLMGVGADFLILESATQNASIYRRISVITLTKNLVSPPTINPVSRNDPLAFTFTDNDFAALAKDAFQELQEANVKEKRVKII
jgi:hypothetical protein